MEQPPVGTVVDYPVKSIHIKKAVNDQWYSVIVGHNNRPLFDSGETYHNWEDCYDIVNRTWPKELFPDIKFRTSSGEIDREHPNYSREPGGRPL